MYESIQTIAIRNRKAILKKADLRERKYEAILYNLERNRKKNVDSNSTMDRK